MRLDGEEEAALRGVIREAEREVRRCNGAAHMGAMATGDYAAARKRVERALYAYREALGFAPEPLALDAVGEK